RGTIKRSLVNLATNLITGPAILIATRVAGLNHKVRHDARNSLAVKVSYARQSHKVVDGERRLIRQELNRESAFAGDDGGRNFPPRARNRAAIASFRIACLYRSDPT